MELPFDFPVIIKPSNSVAYWNCRFPHKKKVFVAQSREEFLRHFGGHLLLQLQGPPDFAGVHPRDDSNMRVMNCYCGRDGKVKLIALGNALLEEHSPEGIGSYAAIINGYDEKLNQQMKNFLEGIGYVGFANFDMKYDHRDGTYKLFEMNLRQGRSSYYVTAAGYNLAKWLVDDVPLPQGHGVHRGQEQGAVDHHPPEDYLRLRQKREREGRGKALIKAGKVCHSYYYEGDRSLKRWVHYKKNQFHYFEKYKRYFGNKGLRD